MTRQFTILARVSAALLLLMLISVSGCSSNNVTGVNHNPVPDTYYGKNIQVIFNQTCGSGYGSCHINGSAYGVNLATYKNVMNSYSSEYGKKVVIPGNAKGSPLIDKVGSNPLHGYRMPYGRSALSRAQIDTLMNWINRGATDK